MVLWGRSVYFELVSSYFEADFVLPESLEGYGPKLVLISLKMCGLKANIAQIKDTSVLNRGRFSRFVTVWFV